MRIGIVGAGVAGLTTAKVLTEAGHEVVIFDRTPDVGGVWSRTRRYPGLTTQSPKAQYSFSDHRMPKEFPEWPSGAQVQEYLASYVAANGLDPLLRLRTTVTAATPLPEGGWQLDLLPEDGAPRTEAYDRLVVANGVFCEPQIPVYDGAADFREAGGQLIAATALLDVEQARDKHVLVVGYGKTACDVTVPVSDVAASTDLVARQLLWKMPRKIANVVNFKMLLLTRMGEALFRYVRLRGVEKFLHGPGDPLRRRMLNSIGDVSVRQFKLEELDLVPTGRMEDIVKGAIGLATEGFFEGVLAGRIGVHKNTVIRRLLTIDGRPGAELSDGSVLPADLVVCATGFSQGASRSSLRQSGRRCSTSAATSCSTVRSSPSMCRTCTSTGTTLPSSPRSTPRSPPSGSPRTWAEPCRCRPRRTDVGRSPIRSRSWTSPSTATTATAPRSSRSR